MDTRAVDAGRPVPILVYHNIDPRFEFSITRITPAVFRRHIAWLHGQGYQTRTLSEVVEMLRRRISAPRRTVAIVFDDALSGVFDHAIPTLVERNFTGTVFPVVEYIGRENGWDVHIGGIRRRHMDWDQLAEAQAMGMEIGSHTMRHADLTRVDDSQLAFELQSSRRILQDRLGAPVNVLSCPFGKCSPRVADRAFENGFTGISLIRGKAVAAHRSGGYILPGAGVYLTTTRSGFVRKADGLAPALWMRWIEAGIGYCASQTPRFKGIPEQNIEHTS